MCYSDYFGIRVTEGSCLTARRSWARPHHLPKAFLCGVCMFSLCPSGFLSTAYRILFKDCIMPCVKEGGADLCSFSFFCLIVLQLP